MRTFITALLVGLIGCGQADALFELRLTNLATDEGIDGVDPTFSPGWAYVDGPLFEIGQPADSALKLLAEQGDPILYRSGPFETGTVFPEGVDVDYESDPLRPAESFRVLISARPGDALSLVTMLIQTNDTFVGGNDIALPFDGEPSRDVTSELRFLDAGTEVNEPLGMGPGQPGQGGDGEVEMAVVRPASDLPEVASVLRVEITRLDP